MSDQISQGAETSIAKLNKRKAFERLERDGAHSSDALRRRARAIAAERNLPPAEIHKLMYKRISTHDVMLFCEKHSINYDWLLAGDLRGLQSMTKTAKVPPHERAEAQRAELMRLFSAFPPRTQATVLGYMRDMAGAS
jgi:hypothetical protein